QRANGHEASQNEALILRAFLDRRGAWTHSAEQGSLPVRERGRMAESPARERWRPVEPAPGNAGEGNSFPASGRVHTIMIASKNSLPHSLESLPNSTRVYVAGKLHPALRVPFREISQSPTKTPSGRIEANEPVRVYDCSG